MKPQGYPNPCEGVEPPDAIGLKSLWIKKHGTLKTKENSDNQ
jgi:hypothetical protein